MERRADPHGVGVDQFFADIGSTIATCFTNNRFAIPGITGVKNLQNQVGCLVVTQEVRWLIFLQAPCCLMQIVQTVAAFGVFTDGDGVKVEKKAPRINYVGFIAPLMTLVSSWIHA